MGFLQDRRILVTGMLSNRSIAYGIAKACAREGAQLAFTYQGEGIRERVADLAKEFGTDLLFPCDVADDAQIDGLFAELAKKWNSLDGLVHAIAFAPREALKGAFHESVSREAFRMAHDISSYSLAALAKGAAPLMQGRKASIVTLTYLGAVRSIPNYNVMGLAKASLEAAVRSRRTRRCAAASPPRKSATPPPSCSPTSRAASPARRSTSTRASAPPPRASTPNKRARLLYSPWAIRAPE